MLSAYSPSTDDDANSVLNFDDDVDRGLPYIGSTNAQTYMFNINEMTKLVDSGTKEHFFDDELIPGLKDRIRDQILLDVAEMIETAGYRDLVGNETSTPYGVIFDNTGRNHISRLPGLVGSGLGCHTFSSTVTMGWGLTMIFETGKKHISKGNVVVTLQQ